MRTWKPVPEKNKILKGLLFISRFFHTVIGQIRSYACHYRHMIFTWNFIFVNSTLEDFWWGRIKHEIIFVKNLDIFC